MVNNLINFIFVNYICSFRYKIFVMPCLIHSISAYYNLTFIFQVFFHQGTYLRACRYESCLNTNIISEIFTAPEKQAGNSAG